MDVRLVYLLFYSISITECQQQLQFHGSHVKELEKLFKTYDKTRLPITNKLIIPVDIFFKLEFLEQIDQNEQVIEVHGTLGVKWEDEALYSNVKVLKQFHVAINDIWHPNFGALNSVSDHDILSGKSWHPALINQDHELRVAQVVVHIPITYRVSCTYDFGNYPYDVQQCAIMLGSWQYSMNEVDFNVQSDLKDDAKLNTQMSAFTDCCNMVE